jgi:hypothetical protein
MVAAVAALALLPAFSASGAEDPEHPGLPAPENEGTYSGARTVGRTAVERAAQWLRLPQLDLVAFVDNADREVDSTCRRLYPYSQTQTWHASANLLSPDDAPDAYGHGPEFTVRTVAFGAVPVEARLSIRQPRDSSGLPVPWTLDAPIKTYCPGLGPHAGPGQVEARTVAATFEGSVRIEVESLRIDGIDVGLAGSCRTVSDAPLDLTSRDYYTLDPHLRPGEQGADWNPSTTRYFQGNNGGLLEGTLDIPRFTGCTTGDDDLSPVLSGLVSSRDNPISVRVSGLSPACVPWESGVGTCTPPDEMELPPAPNE